MSRVKPLLKGKVVIITGAAGGIGQAVARLFAKQGASMVLTDIRMSELERLGKALSKSGTEPLLVTHDVTDSHSWEFLMDKTLNVFGKLDVVVNNAGVVQPGIAEMLSLKKTNQQVSVNLMGTIHGCQAALRVMKVQNFGKIINVASLGGIVPMPGEAVYSATKFAIRGYSFSLYAELTDSPVGISVVCSDSVETPQLAFELLHDEAILSFIGSPLKPDQVARGILKAIFKDKPEILIPAWMGILSRLGMAFPKTFFVLFPVLKWIGVRTMRKRREEEKKNGHVTFYCGDL